MGYFPQFPNAKLYTFIDTEQHMIESGNLKRLLE